MAFVPNNNEIYPAFANTLISIEVFGFQTKGGIYKYVEDARVDGSLYGDTKSYRSFNILHSHPWMNDAENANLLQVNRVEGEEQFLVLDQFRQVFVTTDIVLSKRCWITEAEFMQSISTIKDMLKQTEKAHNATEYVAYLGTAKSSVQGTNGVHTIDISTELAGLSGEEKNRVEAVEIARNVADLMDEIEDFCTDYNDYGYYRSWSKDELKVIWNKAFLNKIKKVDTPTIYHNSDLFGDTADTLMARWFGDVNTSATQGDGSTVRSLIEQKLTGSDSKVYEVFAGDLIPTVCTAPKNTSYTVNDKIVCKIMHKKSVPFMSAFEIGTNFYNPRGLNENSYLTWGYNTLQYLKEFPFLEVQVKTEA